MQTNISLTDMSEINEGLREEFRLYRCYLQGYKTTLLNNNRQTKKDK
jgi:hypothetical protein